MYQWTDQGLSVSTSDVLTLCHQAFRLAQQTKDQALHDYADTVYSSIIAHLRAPEQMLSNELAGYIDELIRCTNK